MTLGDLNFDLSEKLAKVVSKLFLTSFRKFFPLLASTPRSRVRWGRRPPRGGTPPLTAEVPEHQPGVGLTTGFGGKNIEQFSFVQGGQKCLRLCGQICRSDRAETCTDICWAPIAP